nr:hypothetical protein [Tanacetum cinerariifolium]
MAFVVNSVLAYGVDPVLEKEFTSLALQVLKIHSFMNQLRILTMILQTLSTHHHSPRHTLDSEDSLIMGNEELSTIPEKESDEVIKSIVEDLVPIPSESEDTSESDSEYVLPSCDDFSPINVFEAKFVTFSNPLFYDDFTSSDDESLSDGDVPKDNVKIYSNPLFEFDEEYISSDVNPLFDEVLENIESKDSYDYNLDEPDLLVTPLSDVIDDECFDPRGDTNEIDEGNQRLKLIDQELVMIQGPRLKIEARLKGLKSSSHHYK